MINQVNHLPAWKVLLLGGHSGVGKTVVARHLARHYGVGLAEVDDFRLVLQHTTTPEQHPLLHFFLQADIFQRTVDDLRDHLIVVNHIVCSALEIVVANHVATTSPCILEGDGIVPAFAVQQSFANLDVGRTVRAAFIVERDKDRLLQSMQLRERSFDRFSRQEQHHWVELSWWYGRWLEEQAIQYELPVVTSQPWDTLGARIRAAIEAEPSAR
jgi:2-phosphoglycerate kinase